MLLLPLAGLVTAVVAVVIGLPALRVRGLYLAVSTLAFSLWFMRSVLATPCWTLPLVDKRLCTGCPTRSRPCWPGRAFSASALQSERAFAWFSLAVLVLTVLMVRTWRDRGVARRPGGGA